MTTTTNIMNFLDDNKEDMSEGLYLKFCNLLKKENEDEEKEDEKFYEVKYLYTRFDPLDEDSYNYYNMRMFSSTQIIKINTKKYKEIQDDIEKNGYSWKYNNLSLNGIFSDHSICSKQICNDDDCGCENGGHINATTIHISSDTKIIQITEA